MNLQYPELNFTGFNPSKNCGSGIGGHDCVKIGDGGEKSKEIIKSAAHKYSILKSLFEYVAHVTFSGFLINDISTDNVIVYKSKGSSFYDRAAIMLGDKMSSVSDELVRPTRSPFHSQEDKPAFRAPETFVKAIVRSASTSELFHTNSVKSEIWSLGIVFLHLLAGDLPFDIVSVKKPWTPEVSLEFLHHLEGKSHGGVTTAKKRGIVAEENVRWQVYNFFGATDPNTSETTVNFMDIRRKCFLTEIMVKAQERKTVLPEDSARFVTLLTGMLDPCPKTRYGVSEVAKFFGVDFDSLQKVYTISYNEYRPSGGWTLDKEDAVNCAMKAVFDDLYSHADPEIRTVALKAGLQMACAFRPNERPALLYASVLSAVTIAASLYDAYFMEYMSVREFADEYYDGVIGVVRLSNKLDPQVINFFYSTLNVPFKNHGKIFNLPEAERAALCVTDGAAFKARCEFLR